MPLNLFQNGVIAIKSRYLFVSYLIMSLIRDWTYHDDIYRQTCKISQNSNYCVNAGPKIHSFVIISCSKHRVTKTKLCLLIVISSLWKLIAIVHRRKKQIRHNIYCLPSKYFFLGGRSIIPKLATKMSQTEKIRNINSSSEFACDMCKSKIKLKF